MAERTGLSANIKDDKECNSEAGFNVVETPKEKDKKGKREE